MIVFVARALLRVLPAALATLALAACAAGPRPQPPSPPAPSSDNAAKTRPYVVFGRQYVPILSAEGYRERGVASWYGQEFNGRATANGEIFDMHQMTAAHKTLPLPTYVEVTNLRNGRQIVVRVNDRGPFVDNRLIDLSYAAAFELDMIGPGTSLVDVRALDTAASTSAPTPAAAQRPKPITQKFYVQVGAFALAQNADRVRQALEQGGLDGVIVQRVERHGQPLYRVHVGPIDSVEEFDSTIARLDAMGYDEARLAVD